MTGSIGHIYHLSITKVNATPSLTQPLTLLLPLVATPGPSPSLFPTPQARTVQGLPPATAISVVTPALTSAQQSSPTVGPAVPQSPHLGVLCTRLLCWLSLPIGPACSP